MAPQWDWAEFFTGLSAIICRNTPTLEETQRQALSRKFVRIIEHHRPYGYTDQLNADLTKALLPLPMDISHKASLLNETFAALGGIRTDL